MSRLNDAINTLLQYADEAIEIGKSYDRKVTLRGKGSAHISVGKLLPRWQRIRIVPINVDSNTIIWVIKRLATIE